MTPLAALVLVALFVGLVAPILAFTVLIIGQVHQRWKQPQVRRCDRCDGPLLPLLDSSHKFLGEAACLRCGTLHVGLRRMPPDPTRRRPGQTHESV